MACDKWEKRGLLVREKKEKTHRSVWGGRRVELREVGLIRGHVSIDEAHEILARERALAETTARLLGLFPPFVHGGQSSRLLL